MTLHVQVTPPYPVQLEPTGRKHLAEFIPESKIALVSDEHVAPHYAAEVIRGLEQHAKEVHLYTTPAGETSKSIGQFERLVRAMLQDGLDRSSAVLALGGGVVGDLAGFVAASLLRGIAFYQCPTSLLAMVDASIGGKTGINVPEGKNLVGAFWQPGAVMIDVEVLKTLPPRAFRQGASEVFKHGLLADPELLDMVQSANFHPDGPTDFLNELVYRSVAVKAAIVARDEREAGERAYLNLGHTLAHALEAHSQHQLPHGEAVAYGLLFAAKLAALRGLHDETGRALQFLRWVDPAPLGVEAWDELLPYLAKDKKHRSGVQTWVLLERPGQPILVNNVKPDELQGAWRYLQEVCA